MSKHLHAPVRTLCLAGFLAASLLAVPACGGLTPGPSSEPTASPTPLPSPSPSPSPEYVFTEVWTDQFDQASVDASRWDVQDEWFDYWADTMPWRRNYKAGNVYTQAVDGADDGHALVIRTQKETADSGTVSYSTGCLQTGFYSDPQNQAAHLFAQTYGRFEARVKFPTQQGHWPAFWLYTNGVGLVNGDGTDGTEIDIMEKAETGDKVSHALHWDGYASSHRSSYQEVSGRGMADGGWHTFRLDWYPDHYEFYVDGNLTWSTSAGGVCAVPVWIIISEEIGYQPGWGTGPIDAAGVAMPDYYYVDWVRVSSLSW